MGLSANFNQRMEPRGSWCGTQSRTLKIGLNFRPEHDQVLRSARRFRVLVAGRRWGKTTLALWELTLDAASGPDRCGYYVAPTERQAKEIAWQTLKKIVHPAMRRSLSESELSIELINGSFIQLHGANHPDSLRGVGLDFVVLDEYGNLRPETWTEIVRPMLADRQGRALVLGTPKGRNHFYDLYVEAQSSPQWAAFHFTTYQGGFVPEEEDLLLRSGMDPKHYAQEIEASFEVQEGRVYQSFSRELNVASYSMVPGIPLLVGLDFNIDPMCAVVAQKIGSECHVFAEVVVHNSWTQEMMDTLNARFPGMGGVVHPDPSGSARKTSSPLGQTDHAIVRLAGWDLYVTRCSVRDRINNVNAALCNANRQRRLLIDPGCKHLIRALDGLTYKQGTNIPDKSTGLDHICDALGYLISGLYPIKSNPEWSIQPVML